MSLISRIWRDAHSQQRTPRTAFARHVRDSSTALCPATSSSSFLVLFVQSRRATSDGSSLFIGDSTAVRRMDLSTSAVVTIMGGQTSGSADGVGTAALVYGPFGISRNATSGALYLADQGNFTIRVLTP